MLFFIITPPPPKRPACGGTILAQTVIPRVPKNIRPFGSQGSAYGGGSIYGGGVSGKVRVGKLANILFIKLWCGTGWMYNMKISEGFKIIFFTKHPPKEYEIMYSFKFFCSTYKNWIFEAKWVILEPGYIKYQASGPYTSPPCRWHDRANASQGLFQWSLAAGVTGFGIVFVFFFEK